MIMNLNICICIKFSILNMYFIYIFGIFLSPGGLCVATEVLTSQASGLARLPRGIEVSIVNYLWRR